MGKKSGIKLTVYSLQNAVCCLAVIFHEGLPCGAEWVRSPGEVATMEPFTKPPVPRASIHTSSFILEKKLGAPLQSAKVGGPRNFRDTENFASSISRTDREITSRLAGKRFSVQEIVSGTVEIKIVFCHDSKAIAILILNT